MLRAQHDNALSSIAAQSLGRRKIEGNLGSLKISPSLFFKEAFFAAITFVEALILQTEEVTSRC
jgi:hypothetical protein